MYGGNKLGGFGLVVGLVFGAYFVVKALGLLTFPAFLISIDKIIIIISAALLAIAGIYFYKASRNSMMGFMNKLAFLGIAIYFIFALYFANVFFSAVPTITTALAGVEKWIDLVAGILLGIGGISFWHQKRY